MWQVFVKYNWAYATCISALTLQVAGWWVQLADAAVSIGDGVDRNLVILFIAHLYSLNRF